MVLYDGVLDLSNVLHVIVGTQISSTYYSRIHVARVGSNEEVDIDARPSDAINLAVRFRAPMYISKVGLV